VLRAPSKLDKAFYTMQRYHEGKSAPFREGNACTRKYRRVFLCNDCIIRRISVGNPKGTSIKKE